ncbi:MAG: regulatory protein [Paraglaciecola sp.]|jgi:regulatory protein
MYLPNMTDNDSKFINYAITRYLAAREHSRHELLSKLLRKEHDAQLCHQQIDKFSQANIQSEQRFAESLVRSRINKGMGEDRIRRELNEHHIEQELINHTFAVQDADWFELALKVYTKKYGEQPATSWQEQQKRSRFLQYRGFSYEQIHFANQAFVK